MYVCTKETCIKKTKFGMMDVMLNVDVRTLTQDITGVKKGRVYNIFYQKIADITGFVHC